jgi:hypothetical protein
MVTEIEELKEKFYSLQARVEVLESYHKNGSMGIQKDLTIGEFILEYSSKISLTDKTLLIGYFKENIEHISPLTRSIISDGFDEARESPPKNLSDSINSNLDKKFFTLTKNVNNEKMTERPFSITTTGIKHVEEGIEKNSKKLI